MDCFNDIIDWKKQQSLDKSAKDKIFARWITHLSKVTGLIRQEGIQELLSSVPDIPWD